MRKFLLPLAILVFTLSACGDDTDEREEDTKNTQETSFRVQTDNETVKNLLPAIRYAFPGLDRYANQFRDIHVEENYWLTIRFYIPNDAKIPNEFLSQGNNCFIEINNDKTAVKVPKSACKSVALDRDIRDLKSDYWFYLPPDKLTYPPYDFTKLTNEQRIDTGVKYLKRIWDSIQEIKNKSDWVPQDFPNYSRLFKQLEREGSRFATEGDLFAPYRTCMFAGSYAQLWWSNQSNFLRALSSNDSKRMESELDGVVRTYDFYHENAVSCSEDIRKELSVIQEREKLPPTPDGKPPRKGCLMIYSPDNQTSWSCIVESDK